MGAVVVDEGILQRERIQPAGRFNVPRDLLGLWCESALGRVLLNDDDVFVTLERLGEAVAVERLDCVHGDQRSPPPSW